MLGLPRPTLDVPVSLPRQAVVEQAAAPLLSALAFFFVMTSYYIIRPVMGQLSGAVGSQSLPLFYGAVFVVMLLLTPVNIPSELPEIGARPAGNGLSIDVIGRATSCCSVVVCE